MTTVSWIPGERVAARRRGRAGGGADRPEPAADAPVIGVVALQGDVLEHLRALERSGARAVRVRRPADLEGLEGVVVPGGESTTITRLLQHAGLWEPLKEALAAGLPAFGTCAGMILLSSALEQDRPQPVLGVLDVTTRRNAYGRQRSSFETELEVEGLDGGPLRAAFIRAPAIERVGEGVRVLARVDGRPVLVAQGPVLAAAFHPEVTGDDRLHRRFVDAVRRMRPGAGRYPGP